MERKKSSFRKSLPKVSDSLITLSTEVFDFFPTGIILLEEIMNEDGDLNFFYKYQNKIGELYYTFQVVKGEKITFRNNEGIFTESFFKKLKKVSQRGKPLKEFISVVNHGQKFSIELFASKIHRGIIISLSQIKDVVTPEEPVNLHENISNNGSNSHHMDNLDKTSGNGLVSDINKNSKALIKAEEKVKQLEKANQLLKKDFKDQFKELSDKNSLLLKVNNDLDNFVYTASHDLKSPISNIEGLLNALISELPEENSEIKYIIDLLNLSLNKFQTLLHDLSEIAQVQKKDEEDQLINLFELFQDVKFSLHEQILKYGAVVDSDFSKVSELYFSRKNITSIITNLVSNGLKYSSPMRMPEVFVKTAHEDEYFVLSVKDNGLGVKPEDKEKIFSVFKRIYTHVSGSGVGLFIVKRIVDNNGGKIEIESEINKGTTFKVFLKKNAISG